MHISKTKLTKLLLLVILIFTFSCSADNDDKVQPPKSIELNIAELSIELYQTETLKVTTDTKGFDIVWQSSNHDVIQVNNGVINAVGLGKCSVTAMIEQVSASCNIEVFPNHLQLDNIELNLIIGETKSLAITSDTGAYEVIWSSDNKDVAIVTDGVVEAVGLGVCSVTATIGNISVSSTIKVLPSTLDIEKHELDLRVGESVYLPIITETGENQLVWSSDDPLVAEVDENGFITAKGEGQAIIKVELGELSATCVVDVTGYDIYVVGYEGAVAKLWHNGVETNLTDGGTGAQAYAIDIDGEDIYVAGTEFKSGALVAKVWKNGLATDLTNGSYTAYATDIDVSEGNVYVSGYEYNGSNNAVAKVWVNGVGTVLSNPTNPAQAESIFVINGDVFVAGFEYENGNSIAKLWKNGIATNLTDGSNHAAAYGVYVDGEDIFVSGRIGQAAVYWKNNTLTNLTQGLNSGYAYDIEVVEEDIYAVGKGVYLSNKGVVWKNEVPSELTLIGNYTSSNAFSIQVLNGSIFVSGIVYRNMGGFDAAIWVNQELTILSDGQSDAVAKDIFVK